MAELRLKGAQVRALRRALSFSPAAKGIWAFSSRDFHIPEIKALPASKLAPLDPAPVPRVGRPPRDWDDEELGDMPHGGDRVTGYEWRSAYGDGLSPGDVLDRVLDAHKQLGERSPFIELDEPRARKAAQASAKRWSKGKPLGPLDGLIVPVKDEFHMRGLPTRGGTTYNEAGADEDSWTVAQLEKAGAIVIGKTHAVEWGLNPNGVMEHFVGPRNVYSDAHGPGGSSTGSGVATALGLCPSAVGTDGGGSIRIPASLNGVFGLKPTYVRVGRTGDTWGDSSVAHIGPIGQSVADCVDQLEATAGVDPRDPLTRWAPDGHDSTGWRRALGRGLKGATIGYCPDELKDADPAVASLVEQAISTLEGEGARLKPVSLPFGGVINGIGSVIIASECLGNLRDDLDMYEDQFGDELWIVLNLMKQLSVEELLTAQRARAFLRRAMAHIFRGIDLLLLPTTARPATKYALDEDRTPILDTAATASVTRFNFLGNLTGLPAGTVPLGMVRGLPVGLQFVGDAWDEASVIAAMAHWERIGAHNAVPIPPRYFDVIG